MFIKVGGPNGAGKTTVTTSLERVGQEMGLQIQRVKGGDILLSLAGVSSYPELRKIPEPEMERIRPEMYRIMYEEDAKDPNTLRVRDAHFALYKSDTGQFIEEGAQPGDKEQMLLLVVLNPSLNVLLDRRHRQGMERSDRNFDPSIAKMEIQKELEYAGKESADLGVKLIVLPNPDGLVRETSIEIIREIETSKLNKEGGARRSAER